MDNFNWWLVGLAILIAIVGMILISVCIPHDNAIIFSTYEEGFEISHMETAGKHFIISARNDKDSFSVAVGSATYARFVVGDVIHVKVTIYEEDGEYYREYEIMGREGYV